MSEIKTYQVSLPEVALVAVTRGLGGAGVGLLLADRMDVRTRRIAGMLLFAIGVVSTIPLVLEIFFKPAQMHGRDFERNLDNTSAPLTDRSRAQS